MSEQLLSTIKAIPIKTINHKPQQRIRAMNDPQGTGGQPQPPSVDPSQNQAFVDASALATALAGVTAQHRTDTLDSMLFAQSVANAATDPGTDIVTWYATYIQWLGKLGWTMGGAGFLQYQASGATLEIDQAVLDVLGNLAGGGEINIVKAALSALQALPEDDGKFVLFSASAVHSKLAKFQMVSATEQSGQLALNFAAFYLQTDQVTDRFLWFSFDSAKTVLNYNSQAVLLNDSVYSQVRSTVEQRLGTSASTDIANVPIA